MESSKLTSLTSLRALFLFSIVRITGYLSNVPSIINFLGTGTEQLLNYLFTVWAGKGSLIIFFNKYQGDFRNTWKTKQELLDFDSSTINMFFIYLFRSTSNIGCYCYADRTVISAFCIQKMKKIQKYKGLCKLVVRFLLMTALLDIKMWIRFTAVL